MSSAGKFGLLYLAALAASGQDSDQRFGSYRVLNTVEVGYRSVFVTGSRQMYRASVNYDNGLRLLDGIFRVNSGGGYGQFFDEIVLTSFGSGGDPYQSAGLRIERNRLYRYDLGFRIVNYANSLLALSGGERRLNTERIFQNHDLTLFPQSRVQVLFGFDRNNQNGPALNSENIPVSREEAFPRDRFFVFADDVRRLNNTWRVGANVTVWGVKLSLLQGWDFYKEDTRHSLPPDTRLGLVPHSLRRDDPVHGQTPFSRLNIHTDANRRFALNGRFVYAGGERNFVLDENIASLNPVDAVVVTRQAFVLGVAKRTQGSGDLTLSFQPGERWTFSNTTAVNHTRIAGDSAFVEVRAPVTRADPGRDEYFFSLLGIRMVTNSTDLNFRPAKTVGLYGGYHYSVRRVQSREILEDISGKPTDVPLYSFENRTKSGLAGVRLRPVTPLTLLLDVEYGRSDRPFTPAAEKRYHAETARVQLKHRAWLLTGRFYAYRNRNAAPPVLAAIEGTSVHRSQSRQFSSSLAWTPRRRFTLDTSYAKVHLGTEGGIVNFPVPGRTLVDARRSLYVSRLHHGSATARIELRSNATLFLGYSIVKDTAGGRDPAVASLGLLTTYPSFTFDGTDLINAYPLSYQSPQARLTLKLHKKLSWNAAWQYYGYSERFFRAQNYHAHVSYTSLRWAF